MDVVKTPYCGDEEAYCKSSPTVPCRWLRPEDRGRKRCSAALERVAEVVRSGRGAIIGRNIWGFEKISGSAGLQSGDPRRQGPRRKQ